LKICGIASGFAPGYDPTGRSVYYITIDRLTKKLMPKFIFVNACMPRVYQEAEKFVAHFAQN
jgi:hypothetical protein